MAFNYYYWLIKRWCIAFYRPTDSARATLNDITCFKTLLGPSKLLTRQLTRYTIAVLKTIQFNDFSTIITAQPSMAQNILCNYIIFFTIPYGFYKSAISRFVHLRSLFANLTIYNSVVILRIEFSIMRLNINLNTYTKSTKSFELLQHHTLSSTTLDRARCLCLSLVLSLLVVVTS